VRGYLQACKRYGWRVAGAVKRNIRFIYWVTPAASPTYSCYLKFQVAFLHPTYRLPFRGV